MTLRCREVKKILIAANESFLIRPILLTISGDYMLNYTVTLLLNLARSQSEKEEILYFYLIGEYWGKYVFSRT